MTKIKKIMDCSAAWCGPCKALSTTFDKISKMEQFSGIEFEKVDIDSDYGAEIVEKYKVRSIPTIIAVDEEGNELKKIFGNVQENSILEALESI